MKSKCTVTIAFEDLVQAGNIGLVRASENYNKELGAFSTYATYWIREEMYKELNNNSRTVRIPRNVMRQATANGRPYPKDAQKLPENDQVSEELSPYDTAEINELYKLATNAMDHNLTTLQSTVIRLRFVHNLTRPQVAAELNCSKEWVRINEVKALQRLREVLDNDE